MRTRVLRIAAVAPALALLLSGCPGAGGGTGNAYCASITGGGATVSSSGAFDQPARAADGDLGSYASFRPRTGAASASVRATAQAGISFPAGSRAGAFVRFLNQDGSNATTLRTFLRGAPVESSTPTSLQVEVTDAGIYLYITATAPFDAVEFAETDSSTSGQVEYRVHEICSDGHG